MRKSLVALSRVWLPVARTLSGPGGPAGLTVLCWHRVDDGPGPLSVTAAELEAQLDAIADWTSEVLGLEEAWARTQNGTLPRRAIVLTFDDGYRSTLEDVWPRLEARAWPATLFALTGYLDGNSFLPWDLAREDPAPLLNLTELLELAERGMHVGSHTVSHRWLPRLSDQDLAAELQASRKMLQDALGCPVTTLAYPAGHADARVRRAVGEAGYTVALTTARGRSTPRTDRYAVRRTTVPRSAEELVRTLDGANNILRPLDALRERRLVADAFGHPDPALGMMRDGPPSTDRGAGG
jgi:peptidoglycan/xylan/chitin deacetylase (PgdA/CDA1 family)